MSYPDIERRDVPLEQIYSSGRFRQRSAHDPQFVDRLKKSILESGLLRPLLVWQDEDGRYEIIDGEARYIALKELGDSLPYQTIPVDVADVNVHEAKNMAFSENWFRKKLPPLEKAEAIDGLIIRNGIEMKTVAEMFGISTNQAYNIRSLVRLCDPIKTVLRTDERAHVIPLRDLMTVSRLKNEQEQIAAFSELQARYAKGAKSAARRAQEKYSRRIRRIASDLRYFAEHIDLLDKESAMLLFKNIMYFVYSMRDEPFFSKFKDAFNMAMVEKYAREVQDEIDREGQQRI